MMPINIYVVNAPFHVVDIAFKVYMKGGMHMNGKRKS